MIPETNQVVMFRCVECGFMRYLNAPCPTCVLKRLEEDVESLKSRQMVSFKTSCDPDVGWGGD